MVDFNTHMLVTNVEPKNRVKIRNEGTLLSDQHEPPASPPL